MNGRVDPTTTLREEDAPRVRRHRMTERMRVELGLEGWEVLHDQGRQETIFTQRKQVLLVQGVHVRLGVLVNYTVRDDDGTSFVGGANAEEREATGQAGDGTEEALESLCEMVLNIVFIYLILRVSLNCVVEGMRQT